MVKFYEVPPLPELETTLVHLVLELLRSPVTYPQLVLSQRIDSRGEVAPDAVRITYHYVAALQAFGYQLQDYELDQALKWFLLPFPRDQINTLDPIEMNRLEALLLLCPHNADFTAPELMEYIHPRLECLIGQRTPGDDEFEGHFLIHGDSPAFDNLWALKTLAMASERRVLRPTLMSEDELKNALDRLIGDHYRDKDLALALQLRYQHFNRNLKRSQQKYLERLVKYGRSNLGVWDLRQNLMWLVHHMHRQELQIGDVAENRDAFRDMILSTCYVVENLMPMMYSYPHLLSGILQQSIELWWNVFQGEHAADRLHDLFPEPYDYLLILTRTIIAVCAYAGAYSEKPLSERILPHVYRMLSLQHDDRTGSRVQVNLQKALREWMPLELIGEPIDLKLGLSGANVVRIQPRLINPLNPDFPVQFAESLIVKYGPVDEIDLERQNYARLPQAIRSCFVSIPQESYIDAAEGRAYVIMADLVNYYTLYERLPTLNQIRDALLDELGPFLLRMHGGGEAQPSADRQALLWELYLLPMQEYVGRAFRLVRDHALLSQQEQKDAYNLHDELNRLLGALVQQQLRLGEFPTAYMHGDLHSRNIMLRSTSPWETNGNNQRLDFKLIDLEKFEIMGDAAVDAGQFLVDLELARSKMSDTDFAHAAIGQLMERLTLVYTQFGAARSDEMFAARVELARARALLRIAKGRTKYAETRLRESRKAPAIDAAHEVMDYARQALLHLRQVLAVLQEDL
ncbi:MAG: aminoglycoside phosphotransferase family protein [Anaerolineae bacterium]|nr:aminoglycoside phosphotransferase family protein [Anaerolineae bacterium]